jgi:antitoxin component of RelBE/YafQ-DinJ toxin-antitoxin module
MSNNLNIRIDSNLKIELFQLAQQNATTVTAVVTELIKETVKERSLPTKTPRRSTTTEHEKISREMRKRDDC